VESFTSQLSLPDFVGINLERRRSPSIRSRGSIRSGSPEMYTSLMSTSMSTYVPGSLSTLPPPPNASLAVRRAYLRRQTDLRRQKSSPFLSQRVLSQNALENANNMGGNGLYDGLASTIGPSVLVTTIDRLGNGIGELYLASEDDEELEEEEEEEEEEDTSRDSPAMRPSYERPLEGAKNRTKLAGARRGSRSIDLVR